jgi:predicted dehydrogenase
MVFGMKSIKTAVIGAGRLGAIHSRIYSQISNLVCVCDTDPQRKHALENIIGTKINFETDYRKVIKKYNPDAVSIATPTSSHFEIANFSLV